MTKSYAQLKSAIAKLEKEAAALREAETAKVVAQIKESIATFGLTVEQLFGRSANVWKASGKALGSGKAVRKGAGVPKYRHPKTGKTWTGFGKAPGWIATVRNRDKFLIDPSGVVAAPAVEKAVLPVAAAKKATRKARTVAAPVKASGRAGKVSRAAVEAPETKAETAVAKEAEPKKNTPSKKPVATRKAAATPKASKSAVKAPKWAATKATKPQVAAKTRNPRRSTTASAPELSATTPVTAGLASQ